MPHSAPAPFGIVCFVLGLLLAMAAERRAAWAEARDHLRAILRRLEPDHAEAPAIRARLDAAERALGRPAPR